MSTCCGQRRSAMRAAARRPAPAPARPREVRQATAVRQLGTEPVVVRGAVTGLVYVFPGDGTSLSVDGSDVAALLSSGRFGAAD